MEVDGPNLKEEICIHVVTPENETDLLPEAENDPFRMPPFRQIFFRYSIHGQSEVVKSSSFVYASHHSAESWLDIKKLSVALIGNEEVPNLRLFGPTVTEIYFNGQITYPNTAFKMLPQLESLKTVIFNIGFAGHTNEFHETIQEFQDATPQVPSVTSLEIKLNHQLYRNCSEDTKNTFNSVIKSIIKHSSDSFPNLRNISIDLPDTPLFTHGVALLLHSNLHLREMFKIVRADEKIQTSKNLVQRPARLPFDPYAFFPTNSQYNLLRLLEMDVDTAQSE